MELCEVIKIRKVLGNHVDDKVNAMLAYKIMKIIKNTEDEEEFYNKKIVEIATTYGIKNEKGEIERTESGGVKIENDKIASCNKAVEELEKTPVSIEASFTIEELSELSLTAKEMYVLDNIIK